MEQDDPLSSRRRSVAADLATMADSLSRRVLKVTTPVYRTGDHGLPVSEGSAILFALDNIRFLLTAAHVLDHLNNGGLSAQAGDTLAYIGGDVTRLYDSTKVNAEDLVDIRIVRLQGPDWTGAPMERFLRWDELDHESPDPKRHSYALVGYPFTKQPTRPNHTTMEAYAYRVAGLECDKRVYDRLRVNPQVGLLVGFDKRHTWGPEGQVTAPDLYGVSGCGFWRFGRSLRDATRPPLLSAIAIRWERHGSVKHVRGTRIRPILAAIAKAYPDARSIIERHVHGAA